MNPNQLESNYIETLEEHVQLIFQNSYVTFDMLDLKLVILGPNYEIRLICPWNAELSCQDILQKWFVNLAQELSALHDDLESIAENQKANAGQD